MNIQFIRRKVYFQVFVVSMFLLISAIFIFSGSIKSFAESNKDETNQTNKEKSSPTKWITVDDNELKHIQNVTEKRDKIFDLEIVEKHGGLSIIKSDEPHALDLSRSMHEEFLKCAGFMLHETLEAARLSVEETQRAEANQAVAVYSIDNQANVNPMIAETQESQIRETITRLSTDFPNRRYNQPSGYQSANWIKDKWTTLAAGRSDIAVEFYNHPNVSLQPSIILTVSGTTLPNEIVVLGAHQDSINRAGGGETGYAPGADDDASGIAGLTEVIRIMVAKDFRPRRTVKFMAYAAEEIGLVGSNAIAADFQARAVNVVGVLQLDMTNYKGSDATADIRVITDSTNAAQNQFIRELISTYQPSIIFADGTCGYGCSDHASWNNKGFPASFPFEPVPANPTIHTTNDTLDQSNNSAGNSVKYVKLAISYLGEMAKGTLGLSYEGDVAARPNGDGFVNSNDVVQMLRYLNEVDVPNTTSTEFQRADSAPQAAIGDGNGVIDSSDVVQTIRYLNEVDAVRFTGGKSSPISSMTKPSSNILSAVFNDNFNKSELRIENAVVKAGNSVTINVRVDAVGNESQYGFAVLFDPKLLKFTNFAAGETEAGILSCNTTAIAGRIRCSAGNFPRNQTGDNRITEIAAGNDRSLLKITFIIAAKAKSKTPILLNLDSASVSDENADSIKPTTTRGALTIITNNGDGNFTRRNQ